MSSKNKNVRVVREDEILAQQMLITAIEYWAQKAELLLPIRFKAMDISRYGYANEKVTIEALVDVGVTQLRIDMDFDSENPSASLFKEDWISPYNKNICLRAPGLENYAHYETANPAEFLRELSFKKNPGGYQLQVIYMSWQSAYPLAKMIKEQNAASIAA